MNTYKIFFFGLLFSACGAFSQNFNRQNNNGLNRDVGRDYPSQTKPSQQDIEKSRAEQLDKIIAKLKTVLTLDELQVIAIRNEITSNSKNIDIVIKKETSEEEKGKEVKALMEKTEVVINSYLNKDQKEKYKAFIEESKSGKKDKKSKKDTKKPEE